MYVCVCVWLRINVLVECGMVRVGALDHNQQIFLVYCTKKLIRFGAIIYRQMRVLPHRAITYPVPP